jgi:hypothetical protein
VGSCAANLTQGVIILCYTNESAREPILIKLKVGEFCEKLLRNFSFYLDRPVITATCRNSLNTFLSSPQTITKKVGQRIL